MKQILLILLVFPVIANAQKKNIAYAKLSPALIFQKDHDMRLAGFGTVGARLSHYIAAGVTAGYFKLDGASKAVVPFGLDLNITDLRKKKGVSPIFSAGLYYPFYNERIETREHIYTASGQFMYSVGGGAALSITGKQKIFVTISFSQLNIKAKQQVTSGSLYDAPDVNLVLVGMSYMF